MCLERNILEKKLVKTKQVTHAWLPLEIAEQLKELQFKISDMYLVPKDAIKFFENDTVPQEIKIFCPYCGYHTVFQIGQAKNWHNASDSQLRYRGIDCSLSDCGNRVHFAIYHEKDSKTNYGTNCFLWMYPYSKAKEASQDVLSVITEERQRNSYLSAISTLNNHEPIASSVMVRRLLEGLLLQLLPEGKYKGDSLADKIKALPEHKDFNKPIIDLAHILRKGGNLGAHLDDKKDPDETIAKLMLELTEDLIEYIFVLPHKITELVEQIESS